MLRITALSVALLAVAGLSQGQEFSTFACPGQGQTVAMGINARGDIVGWTGLGYWIERHGFVYRHGECTTFDPPNSWGTVPIKINAVGHIVGYYWDGNAEGKERGFLFRDGEFTILDFLDSSATQAMGINAGGEIVGYYLDANWIAHGFLLKNGQYERIEYPDGAVETFVVSITDAGQIAGGYRDGTGQIRGFVRNERGTFVDFAPPPASVCENGIEVWDMNLKGEIVGRCWATNWYARGFLFKDGKYTLINYSGGAETLVNGINAESHFVGVVWWGDWSFGDGLIGTMKANPK